MLPGDEVAFQLADSPGREPVPPEPEIDIEHVLQRGPVVQVHIDVPGEVDTGVGKVVLPPPEGLPIIKTFKLGLYEVLPPP